MKQVEGAFLLRALREFHPDAEKSELLVVATSGGRQAEASALRRKKLARLQRRLPDQSPPRLSAERKLTTCACSELE